MQMHENYRKITLMTPAGIKGYEPGIQNRSLSNGINSNDPRVIEDPAGTSFTSQNSAYRSGQCDSGKGTTTR